MRFIHHDPPYLLFEPPPDAVLREAGINQGDSIAWNISDATPIVIETHLGTLSWSYVPDARTKAILKGSRADIEVEIHKAVNAAVKAKDEEVARLAEWARRAAPLLKQITEVDRYPSGEYASVEFFGHEIEEARALLAELAPPHHAG